jgi:hypothetical protein
LRGRPKSEDVVWLVRRRLGSASDPWAQTGDFIYRGAPAWFSPESRSNRSIFLGAFRPETSGIVVK